jgi:hypothetical protein
MGESETPWALVTRLRANGSTIEQIVAALKEQLLSREDIDLLLQDDEAYRAWTRGRPVEPVASQVASRSPQPPADVARIVRWVVITLGALASGVALAIANSAVGAVIAFGVASPALVLLVIEFRKGVRRTARPLGFVLFFAFIGAVVSGFIGGWDVPAILGAMLFVSSVPLIVWASRTGEHLKGIHDFEAIGALFESNELQFTVSWNPEPVGPGQFVEVKVMVQNCVDEPRRLQLEVKGGMRSPVTPISYLEAIEPGCIVEVQVPVAVPAIAEGSFSFVIDVQGSGSKMGRRVRLQRGETWVTPGGATLTNVLGAATLLGAGVGLFQLGSNGVITVKVDESRATPISTREVTSKQLYQPAASELSVAAKS